MTSRLPAAAVPIALLLALATPARAQCPDGSPPPCARAAPRPRPAPMDSFGIAILYLTNLSRDTADAAIGDGLTEEIIARLSRVRGLRAASRHASLRYRGRPGVDPRQVGPELGTRYVLDGSLHRTGSRLRVVLTMTDAATGFNVWGRTFERPIQDIFSIQDSVAIGLAETLLGGLSAGERRQLAPSVASTSIAAYEAFLRGQVAIRSRRDAASASAVSSYREAIRIDPRFARAWAALAQALTLSSEWGWAATGLTPDSLSALARHASDRALSLDSASSEAWVAAAMVVRRSDARRGVALIHRAIALDSSNVEAIHQMAWGQLVARHVDSAIMFERLALERDPFYGYAYTGLAEMLNVDGRPDEALAVIARGQAVDSAAASLYWHQAVAAAHLGRFDLALAVVNRAEAQGTEVHAARVMRAIIRLRQGDTASVRAELPELERTFYALSRNGRNFSFVWPLSALHAQLGDGAAAVRWAPDLPGAPASYYAVIFQRHWLWDPVRHTPEFRAFLARIDR